MSTEMIAVIAVVAGVGLLLLWRTVRLFIRLAIFGLIILLVLGWLGWEYGLDNPFGQNGNRPTNTRREGGR